MSSEGIPSPAPPSSGSESQSQAAMSRYWCHQCHKQVGVQTLFNRHENLLCLHCNDGFVESILPDDSPRSPEGPTFNRHFLHLLRSISQAANNQDPPIASVPEPLPESPGLDYVIRHEFNNLDLERRRGDDVSAAESGQSRMGRDVDWSDVYRVFGVDYMAPAGSENNALNPGDYVDVAGYEAVLQNLAESDDGSRLGPPPAARSAVSTLPTVEIKGRENVVCAVCKEGVLVGESAKKLPCEHVFHVDCIVPWLETRNTCPACRFELPTDDEEYEKGRRGRR